MSEQEKAEYMEKHYIANNMGKKKKGQAEEEERYDTKATEAVRRMLKKVQILHDQKVKIKKEWR